MRNAYKIVFIKPEGEHMNGIGVNRKLTLILISSK
jgi:hypothetical protein